MLGAGRSQVTFLPLNRFQGEGFSKSKSKGKKITRDKVNKLNSINIRFLYIKNTLTKLKGEWPTMENIYNKDDRRWIFFNYIKLLHINKEEKTHYNN